MMIKALKSFAGAVTMAPGEIRDIPDEFARDYVRAGYAVAIDDEPKNEPKNELKEEPSGAEEAPAATAADEEPKKPARKSRR